MKKRSSIVQIAVFSVFIAALSILCLVTPSKEFSQQENRYLDQAPKFSFESLFSGKFIKDFEDYVTDQFVFRDNWISLKSRFERLLGKTENNGVFFCKDDTLISRFDEPDPELVANNIDAVNALAANTGAEVYLSLIPGAVSIWADKLPANAVNCDQKALIEDIYRQVDVNTVDNYSALSEHAEEYIYYRTDHHWTSLGAYYGYTALAESMGLTAKELNEFAPETVSEEFYGTVYSSSGVRWVEPDSIDIFVPADGISVTNYPNGKPEEGVVYDMSKLEVKDKYAMFFGGNTPMLEISTGNSEKPRLLVLRDSYSDSELPFLFEDFSYIAVLDLRYYKLSIAEFIENNRIDTVLVNYSVDNFTSDNTVFRLGL
ncbi:MAG: DHHW family protein [Clostridiales bacterium]|nr:DHHW family protein [Clostridiales bacterium]